MFLAQITQQRRVVALATGHFHFAQGRFHRKFFAVGAQAGHLAASPHWMLAQIGDHEPLHVHCVLLAQPLGHQHREIAAQQLGRGAAEHALGSRIDHRDAHLSVDGDDAFQRSLKRIGLGHQARGTGASGRRGIDHAQTP